MPKESKDTAIYVAYDDHVPYDPAKPERELLRAILMTAMSDLKRSGEVGRQAKAYFLSTDDAYIFSFYSVCKLLDVDPDTILVITGLKGPELWIKQSWRHQKEASKRSGSATE